MGPHSSKPSPVPGYTAAKLALALRINKRSVLKALVHTSATGVTIVRGNDTPTWTLEALPEKVRSALATLATEHGLGIADYLAVKATIKAQPWQPPLALSEVHPDCLAECQRLREALLPALQRHESSLLSAAERTRLGLADYQRVFGHSVTERHWRRLIERTLQRDCSAEDFQRLELYLPENPKRKANASRLLPHEADFVELRQTIQSFKNPNAPSLTEKTLLWAGVCELFNGVETKAQQKKLRRQLVKFLVRHAPCLARSTNALRVTLSRKVGAFQSSDGDVNELVDGRAESKRNSFCITEDETKMLVATAALFGGGMNMAWRERYSQLGEETRKHYPNKRFCPRKIRNQIRPLVDLEKKALKGPKHVRVTGAYVSRDPDSINSGDWDQSDDMTPVNYWWDEDKNDPRGFWFGQGQWLPWIDERSWFIYSHDLITDPYYDAFNIRNSWTKKAAEWGLPRCGLSLERGIWKRSRILVGRADEIDPDETELGLRRFGLRFYHSTEARGKVIERCFAELQNYFQAAPGYCGRNQIMDRYEKVQTQIALVKSGKAHPADLGFLHKSEIAQVFTNVVRLFNERPMFGKYHNGLSPVQVFEKCFTTKLLKVPNEFRWLLASHKRIETVSGNGVRIRFSNKPFQYKGTEAGRLTGERVITYFNPEHPEMICCTDLNGNNPFVLEREVRPGLHDESPEKLERALAQNAAQNQFRRELHRSLKPYYKSEFFQNIFRPFDQMDRQALENTIHFTEERNRIESAQREQATRTSNARRAYSKLGMPIPKHLRPGAEDAAAELARMMAEKDKP